MQVISNKVDSIEGLYTSAENLDSKVMPILKNKFSFYHSNTPPSFFHTPLMSMRGDP